VIVDKTRCISVVVRMEDVNDEDGEVMEEEDNGKLMY
jgi:hypothetical protein